MISKYEENVDGQDTASQSNALWTGPSKLLTIRIAKAQPFDSLLKSTFKEPTAFKKRPQHGIVHLGHMGFGDDEHAYPPHQTHERAILQYNPDHYPEWKKFLKEIKVEENSRREALLQIGGFGENIAVENLPNTPVMDESTMCIGDLVAFQNADGTECAQARVNAPRQPCYKLNHRFGIPNMSQRTQDKGWTGWLYNVVKEGDVQAGDQMVLLERPFPKWTVSRISYYCFKDPRNFDMMRVALDTVGHLLATDIRKLFQDRLKKGIEDETLRLQGDYAEDTFVKFRLRNKIRESDRVSKFVLERMEKIPKDSSSFEKAKSGSHVRLRLQTTSCSIVRPYSVISGDSNTIHLGIALADESRGGSAYMHHVLKPDSVLEVCNTFANTFPLQKGNVKEHIFLAGGIGITAFLDHVKYCLATNQKFHLHYMIRNKSDYAFKTMIEPLFANASDDAKLTVYVSADGHRCDLKQLMSSVASSDQTHVYVCGSEKLSGEVRKNTKALKIPDSRVHFEAFGVDATGDPFTVKTSETKKEIEVGSRQSLLDALRQAGLEVASSCEAGNCGTRRIRVKCGRVLHKGTGLMDDEKAGYNGNEAGDMLSCVSRGVGRITIEV